MSWSSKTRGEEQRGQRLEGGGSDGAGLTGQRGEPLKAYLGGSEGVREQQGNGRKGQGEVHGRGGTNGVGGTRRGRGTGQ